MNIKNTALSFFLLLSISMFSQKSAEYKGRLSGNPTLFSFKCWNGDFVELYLTNEKEINKLQAALNKFVKSKKFENLLTYEYQLTN